jgi:hypothetical protein
VAVFTNAADQNDCIINITAGSVLTLVNTSTANINVGDTSTAGVPTASMLVQQMS